MPSTSEGLKALLERKGIAATGDQDKDIELARTVMPKSRQKNTHLKRRAKPKSKRPIINRRIK